MLSGFELYPRWVPLSLSVLHSAFGVLQNTPAGLKHQTIYSSWSLKIWTHRVFFVCILSLSCYDVLPSSRLVGVKKCTEGITQFIADTLSQNTFYFPFAAIYERVTLFRPGFFLFPVTGRGIGALPPLPPPFPLYNFKTVHPTATKITRNHVLIISNFLAY